MAKADDGERLQPSAQAHAHGRISPMAHGWERAEALRHAAEKERLRVAQREQQEAFTAQMAALQAESASQLSAAEEAKRRALDLQRVELMGTSEQLAARAERDREERVQLLRRQIARHLHQDLVRWSTWHEQWELQSYQQRVLRQVAMRLSKPAVSGAYRFWCEEWQAAERKSMREAAESVTTPLKTSRLSSSPCEPYMKLQKRSVRSWPSALESMVKKRSSQSACMKPNFKKRRTPELNCSTTDRSTHPAPGLGAQLVVVDGVLGDQLRT